MLSLSQLRAELSRFCDLDSELVATVDGNDFLARFHQRGQSVQLRIAQDGNRVLESRDGEQNRHLTYNGLLGSREFGDLKRFAEAQRALLNRDAPYISVVESHLPIVGALEAQPSEQAATGDLFERANNWLLSGHDGSVQILALIVDGPAGIGKTHLIRRLVHERLRNFGPGSPPPILHVQSRGRKLTTLNDVIAGTLQSMRLTLTFDQVPILARRGLLQIAIDGFDELADPDGYDTAWASVRDFLEDIGGNSALLLAGRETFIDAVSVRRALPRLDTPATAAVHLRHLVPLEARRWLVSQGWSEARLEALERAGLLEKDSYALRPFFISQIGKVQEASDFEDFMSFPLKALVDKIIERESKILGGISSSVSETEIGSLLLSFYQEVARDMSDLETDAIEDSSLSLIAELVFANRLAAEHVTMLRHRVRSLVLLETDVSPERRRFSHTEIQDFFLSLSYLSNIIAGEIPKSVRRNIIGSDTLETFIDVIAGVDRNRANALIISINSKLQRRDLEERERKNIAALGLAAVSSCGETAPPLEITEAVLDEAILRGNVGKCRLSSVDFAQLDVRGADLSSLQLLDCKVGVLIANDASLFPPNFPEAGALFVEEKGRRKQVVDPRLARDWLHSHSTRSIASSGGGSNRTPFEELFEKLCRVIIRHNWIRWNDDDREGRLLDSPFWEKLKDLLVQEELLISRSLAAQGPRSEFIKIRRARDFLDAFSSDPEINRVRSRVAALVAD